jgi:hypothetical protein
MLKTTLALCLAICGVFIVKAQPRWEKSLVLPNSVDTLSGEIYFEDWQESPHQIRFRDSESERIFSAKEVKAFSILSENQWFVSGFAEIKYYYDGPIREGSDPLKKTVTDHFFMEVIYRRGGTQLLRYLDEFEDKHFFLADSSDTIELVDVNYSVMKGTRVSKVHRPYYRSQMKARFSDCPTLDPKYLEYNEVSLVKLFDKYFSCKGSPQLVTLQEKNVSWKFGTLFGFHNLGGNLGYFTGASIQYLQPKKFSRRFMLLSIGYNRIYKNIDYDFYYGRTMGAAYVSAYGGTYLGDEAIRPLVFGGISNSLGALDIGAGLEIKRKVSILAHNGIIAWVLKGRAYFAFEARYRF